MNDDLGNFPKPPSLSPNPTTPDPISPAPTLPTTPNFTPPAETASSSTYTPPAFEPTPDEIPSTANSPVEDFFPEVKTSEPEKIEDTPKIETSPANNNYFTPSTPQNEPVMATTAPVAPSSNGSLLTIVLLLVAGVGISGSVFLYSQSAALKKQLTDITKTLEQQKTIITPSPTPTVIEIPTPTPAKESTEEATITPTPIASPSISFSKEFIPLALAPQALKVGINKEPNAQLILVKAENATDKENSVIKYFFRKDLTTKKYFYVSINSKNESEINDNAIYVNPDNNIPSLNDLVLGNKLGIDFKAAYDVATKLCTVSCTGYPVNAQFIMSGANTIWQITLDPAGKKFIVQINSVTKEVLYKSPNI